MKLNVEQNTVYTDGLKWITSFGRNIPSMTRSEPGKEKVKHEVGMLSPFQWDPYVAQYRSGLGHP